MDFVLERSRAGGAPVRESTARSLVDLARSQQRLLGSIARRDGTAMLSEARRVADDLGAASTVSSALRTLEGKELLTQEGEEWVYLDPALRLWVLYRVEAR